MCSAGRFCDGHIEGRWADVAARRGQQRSHEAWSLIARRGPAHMRQTASTGGMTAKSWRKIANGLNDIFILGDGTGAGMVSRFDRVLKNPGFAGHDSARSSLLDNLKPYRDQTVVFGHIITVKADPFAFVFGFDNQAPHVNFGRRFRPQRSEHCVILPRLGRWRLRFPSQSGKVRDGLCHDRLGKQ